MCQPYSGWSLIINDHLKDLFCFFPKYYVIAGSDVSAVLLTLPGLLFMHRDTYFPIRWKQDNLTE